mgnify:CR=1 FL=1
MTNDHGQGISKGESSMPGIPVTVGEGASFTKTVSEFDIYQFAGITGDFSPNHTNQFYMEHTHWGRRMAHGALLIGFIATASKLAIEKAPDPWKVVPVSVGFDKVRFPVSVFLGDTVTVDCRFVRVEPERRRSVAEARVTNQQGILVAFAYHTFSG